MIEQHTPQGERGEGEPGVSVAIMLTKIKKSQCLFTPSANRVLQA